MESESRGHSPQSDPRAILSRMRLRFILGFLILFTAASSLFARVTRVEITMPKQSTISSNNAGF